MTETSANPDRLHDPDRLAEIVALDLLAVEGDEVLEEIVARAAELLNSPMAMVSVVLDEAQLVAAHHGPLGWVAEAGGHPAEWSFCANTIRSGQPFVVEDAATHPLTRDNPLVTIDGARSYAGIPLLTSRGQPVGSLCVIGAVPRAFSAEELAELQRLAERVMERLEARREAE
jgi:GAF domain-containing protein